MYSTALKDSSTHDHFLFQELPLLAQLIHGSYQDRKTRVSLDFVLFPRT